MTRTEGSSVSKTPGGEWRTQALILQEQIESEIIRGEFSPDNRLAESSLAERYGLSRTPVREAMLKGPTI